MALADQIIGVESGGNPNARNPLSSAAGAGQFINSTWLATVKSHRPDLAQGKSDDEILAMRSDPGLSREMTSAYAADNAGILSRNGLPVTPGTTYLAHFAGPQGAVGLLSADPNAPAASVLGPGFAKANPSMANMSAGEIAAWADRKMGGGAAPMSMAGPQAAPQSAPSQPAPSQPQPQNNAQAAPAASAPAPSRPTITPDQIAQMAAVPQAQNILPARPNPFGLTRAPFSLGGIA